MKARGKREARRPWIVPKRERRGLKGRNTAASIAAFQALNAFWYLTRGDALRFASRLPLAFIFRAFGAWSFALASNKELALKTNEDVSRYSLARQRSH